MTCARALYCLERDYRSEKILTEELDESSRKLREYWERFSFHVIGTNPKIGV